MINQIRPIQQDERERRNTFERFVEPIIQARMMQQLMGASPAMRPTAMPGAGYQLGPTDGMAPRNALGGGSYGGAPAAPGELSYGNDTVRGPAGMPVMGSGPGGAPENLEEWLIMANQGATRNQPLHPRLVEALGNVLPDMGLRFRVTSGGQPAAGSGGARTGSTRHDHGLAADGDIFLGDRMLSHTNPEDRAIFIELVRRLKAQGLTGFGAMNPALGEDDYMGSSRIHVGYGAPAVWSSVRSGQPVVPWLREAYYGS